KVRILPPRGSAVRADESLWKVLGFETVDGERQVRLELQGEDDQQSRVVPASDLVVVAEFRDYIYPGLVSTGRIQRSEDRPYHAVINGENFHALEALSFTHRGK